MASRCAAGICCKGGAGAAAGQLLVAGGFDFSQEESLASCESIDIADLLAERPAVQACPSLQHARACPGLAAASEAVLAVGGGSSMFTAAEAFRSVEVLRTAATKWQYGPTLQRPRCAAGVCVTSAGHVYAISGYAGNDCYEDSVEWADGSSEGLLRGWFPGPALSQARAGCAACFGPDGRVWVLGGGCDESASLDTVECLDPREGRWCQAPCMPGRRRCFAASFGIDRKLYIYGGWNRERWHEDSAARLDLRNLRWETLASPVSEAPAQTNSVIPYHFVNGAMSSSSSPSLARPFADLPHGATPPLSRRGEGHLLGGPLGSTGYPPRHVLTSPRKSPGDVRFGGPLGATMGATIYTPRQVLVSPRLTPRMPAGATSVIAYAPGLPSGFIPVAAAPKVSRPVEVAVRKQTPRFIRVSARSQERIPPISREVTAAASAAALAAAPVAATDGAAREVELEAFPKQADAASHVASPRSPHAVAAPEVASPPGLEASPRDPLYHPPLAHAASDIQASPMVRQRTLPGYLGQAMQPQMPPERQSSIAVITTITAPSYAVAVPRPSSVGRGSLSRAPRAPELTSDRPPARAVGEALRADSRRRWRRPAPTHAPGTPGVAPHVPAAPVAAARVHGPCHGRTSWSGTPPASAPVSAPPAQSRQGEGDFTPAFFRLQEKLSYLAEEGTVQWPCTSTADGLQLEGAVGFKVDPDLETVSCESGPKFASPPVRNLGKPQIVQTGHVEAALSRGKGSANPLVAGLLG
eukprot:s3541_g10.t4